MNSEAPNRCAVAVKSGTFLVCALRAKLVGGCRRLVWVWPLCALLAAGCPTAFAQPLLKGEFGNIDLGRPLVEPNRIPTLSELRQAVRKSEIEAVLMFKLHGDGGNYYLPVWSSDGQRLALQRSDIQARSSKLLVFQALSQAAPTLIDEASTAYDSAFRFSVPSGAAFVFTRIETTGDQTQVYFSPDGAPPTAKTSGQRRHALPALYERTDGIWRLIYEADGQLMHQAWNAAGPVEAPVPLARGTWPSWHHDGTRLLFARERTRAGPTAAYDIVVRHLQKETDVVLTADPSATVRSPSWSPDGEHAAFYARPAGENKPWQIHAGSANGGNGRDLGQDVVVNSDFSSAGPSWEPLGRRVWFFSHAQRRKAYYPLVAADIESGQTTLVNYPERCTVPNDLALNPACEVPELAFVAHDGRPQDLFVLFLNHY